MWNIQLTLRYTPLWCISIGPCVLFDVSCFLDSCEMLFSFFHANRRARCQLDYWTSDSALRGAGLNSSTLSVWPESGSTLTQLSHADIIVPQLSVLVASIAEQVRHWREVIDWLLLNVLHARHVQTRLIWGRLCGIHSIIAPRDSTSITMATLRYFNDVAIGISAPNLVVKGGQSVGEAGWVNTGQSFCLSCLLLSLLLQAGLVFLDLRVQAVTLFFWHATKFDR